MYEINPQGHKWWGDPSSSLYGQNHDIDNNKGWDNDPINMSAGALFSESDQFVLNTLFFPLSKKFDYISTTEGQFRADLKKIKTILDKPLDFELSLSEKFLPEYPTVSETEAFKSFHAMLIASWNLLNNSGTYPNMVKKIF